MAPCLMVVAYQKPKKRRNTESGERHPRTFLASVSDPSAFVF